MSISLREFESEIDTIIVSRGHDYFSNGAVSDLKQIKDDAWVAFVEGTERYRVNIILKGDDVLDYSCSCPYALSSICKHIVAVFYELRDRKYSQDKEPEKPQNSSKVKQKAVPQESLDQTLSRMSRNSLEAVILEYASREPEIADYILAKQTLDNSRLDKEQYRKIIKNSIDSARGKHGYIGYWQASKVVEGARMVLDKANECVSSQNRPQQALPIYQCILEEMVPLLQDADDSSGEIGSIIEQTIEGLSIYARQAKGTFREKLLDYLFDEFEYKRYDEWSDWKWDFLELAAQMVNSSEEQEILFQRIDQFMETRSKGKHDWVGSYDAETALGIKLTVLERQGIDKNVEDFLKEHMSYPAMRQRAIELAFERKDFALVNKLSQEGIALAKQQNFPGLIDGWNIWMLRVAEAEHNIPEIKRHALSLFLGTGDFDYYKRYKKCFSTDGWKQELQQVINLIKKSKPHHQDTLAQIFIQEQKWSDLLSYVQDDASACMLDYYEKFLSSRFPQELALLYEKVIVKELAPLVGRSNYQRICQFLRRMKKIGAQESVKSLIEELSVKYKNRPALLEEMQKL